MARGKLNRGQQAARQVRVGVVIVAALLVLAFGIFQVGRLFDVFASRYSIVTLLESSGGLIEGAPVTLAGQRIGQVETIRFIPVEQRVDSAAIFVALSINQDVRDQIRRDSRAALQTQGLLGDRYVDISPGSPELPALEPGDTVPSDAALDYESVLRTAAVTMDQVQAVIGDLRTITDDLAQGRGTLGALLVDDRLYERMTRATTELAGVLRAVNSSDGTLSRIIDDPALYTRMTATLARLDSLSGAILEGDGSLGRLVRDDSLYHGLVGVVGRADSTLGGLNQLLTSATDGEGTVARLVEDPELYDQLLRTIVELQTLIQALREDPSALSPEIRVF